MKLRGRLPRRRAPAEVASDECNSSSVRTILWNEIPKLPSLPLNYCLTDYFSVKNIFLTRWPSEGSKNKCWMEQREKPGVMADVTAFIWWWTIQLLCGFSSTSQHRHRQLQRKLQCRGEERECCAWCLIYSTRSRAWTWESAAIRQSATILGMLKGQLTIGDMKTPCHLLDLIQFSFCPTGELLGVIVWTVAHSMIVTWWHDDVWHHGAQSN